MKRVLMMAVGLLACAIGQRSASAEGVWFPSHQFCGSTTANVFDGGPPIHLEGCLTDPNEPVAGFVPSDFTQPGALGASASASAESSVFAFPDQLSAEVRLIAAYSPSLLPGGDNPGGEAEAELSSVIEFTMPVDELGWDYFLQIREDAPFFEGSTLITVENVTQSQTLLTLTENTNVVHTALTGAAGDLIRITSDMSGAGSMGPGSFKEYNSRLLMIFTPEPGGFLLLLVGILAVPRRGYSA